MPNIEISAEQAAALARGENVTITAPEPPTVRRVLAVHPKTGGVFLLHDATKVGNRYAGKYQCLRAHGSGKAHKVDFIHARSDFIHARSDFRQAGYVFTELGK